VSTFYEAPGRARGIEDGLAARVHDPLWFLARQWQFGEFRHENAASPAWVETVVEAHRVDQWRPADETGWQPYDVNAVPLERMVEEHAGGPSPRLRLDGGLRWRRLLDEAGHPGDLAAYVARCPFPVDPLLGRGVALLRAGLPDGVPLAETLQRLAADGTRAAELATLREAGPVAADADQLGELATTWLAWWSARTPRVVPPEEDCWDEHRLEHRFALRSTGLPGVELRAQEYAGGHLDWSSVDAVGGPGAADAPPLVVTQRGVPAPARYGGMPAARFWEMEDARFDPGSVDAAPIDLGRLMLVGFATVYGNDWFTVPVRLPVGSLSRVASMKVRDVFGDPDGTDLTQVAADQDGWNLFGLTLADQPLEPDQERPTSPWFLLPPSLPASLEGPATDAALLLRDEMVNVAWAVESLVADDAGQPRDRFAEWVAQEHPDPVTGEVPMYRVATDVPDHWFPLVPERVSTDGAIRLRLVPLSRVRGDDVESLWPTGTLLPSGPEAWLHEEEVPRAGVSVERTWQHARWHDGSRHVWQTRRRRTGRGEGDSGLRFDQVDGGPPG